MLFGEIKDNFTAMKKLFDQKDLNEFAHLSHKKLRSYPLGLGAWVQNNMLFEGSKLCLYFLKEGINSKDEMTHIVIEAFQVYVRMELGKK